MVQKIVDLADQIGLEVARESSSLDWGEEGGRATSNLLTAERKKGEEIWSSKKKVKTEKTAAEH